MANQRNKQSTGSGSNLNLLHIDARNNDVGGYVGLEHITEFVGLLCAEHTAAPSADAATAFITPGQIGEAIANSLCLEMPPDANKDIIAAMSEHGFKLKFIIDRPGIKPGMYFIIA